MDLTRYVHSRQLTASFLQYEPGGPDEEHDRGHTPGIQTGGLARRWRRRRGDGVPRGDRPAAPGAGPGPGRPDRAARRSVEAVVAVGGRPVPPGATARCG